MLKPTNVDIPFQTSQFTNLTIAGGTVDPIRALWPINEPDKNELKNTVTSKNNGLPKKKTTYFFQSKSIFRNLVQ